jgi:putative endopeptidase
LSQLDAAVDPGKWFMTPQTLNAYYNFNMNEIVFPAAILQPPVFDPAADPAVNFGAIGAVIGHEITHGFDGLGRQYNHLGQIEDWWEPADAQRFEHRAELLGRQYAKFRPASGGRINPELTMGENIADNGGLRMAFEAYHMSLKGSSAPVLNGLSGDQRFFLSWAQAWAAKTRQTEAEKRLLVDPHSPPEARGTLPQCNMAPWYAAFGISEGDKYYLAPQNRTEIWYEDVDSTFWSWSGFFCSTCALSYPRV